MKYFISGSPARQLVASIMNENPNLTHHELVDIIEASYEEPWFRDTKPSYKRNDFVLYHMIRSIDSAN